MPVEKTVLPNGLTVISDYLPGMPVVAVEWRLFVGARQDRIAGQAHFLEHMLGSSIAKSGPREETYKRVDRVSSESNYASGRERISSFVHTDVDHFKEVVELIGNAISNPVWGEDIFLKEKQVILEEIDEAQFESDLACVQLGLTKSYARNVLNHKSTLGFKKTVNAMQSKDLHAFRQDHFNAERMAIVVSGGIDPNIVAEVVEQYFGKIKQGGTQVREEIPMFIPGQRFASRNEGYGRQNIMFVWEAVESSHADLPAFRIMSAL